MPLTLDTTGEFLAASLLGAHDNSAPDAALLRRCLDCLDLIGCD